MKKILFLGLVTILLTGCVRQQMEVPEENTGMVSTLVAATLTAEPQTKDNPDLTAVASVSTITPDSAIPTTEPSTPTLNPTNTDLPSQTPPPTETPTETPLSAETQTPTETQAPTLAPEDPVLLLGGPSVEDTFDNGSIIYQYDESDSSFQVDNDRFVIVAKNANGYETWSMSWEELTNFYLEITGTFGENCGGKDRYGMIFRAPDTSNGYLITIACDGSTRLSKWESEDEKYTILKNWTPSEWINSGAESENRLGVWVEDSDISGYINGHKVFEVSDDTFSKGQIGVVVAASNTPGFTAYLSKVVYWKLP